MDLYDETFRPIVDAVLEGYNGRRTDRVTCSLVFVASFLGVIVTDWDDSPGMMVLGWWSWDGGPWTVVLGWWSWDGGPGMVVLGWWSWDGGPGMTVLG